MSSTKSFRGHESVNLVVLIYSCKYYAYLLLQIEGYLLIESELLVQIEVT